ncbi:MAG TPA: endolytic transglycosylase MltG [Chloroflexia bacterium]|nr:endolytic transglycosylase MltG [Chloroflexia bacterium]
MSTVFRLFRYLLGIGVILLVLASGVTFYALTDLNRPANAANGQQLLFTIAPGESVATIATRLEQQHLITSATLFRLDLKLRNVESAIKAGDFQLAPSQTPQQIIDTITQPPSASLSQVLIPEGWRIGQIADRLAALDIVDKTRFLSLTMTGTFHYDFLPDRPRGGDIEGYLFPDTYSFARQGTGREQRVLDMMLANFGRRITPDLRGQATERGYTLHQIVTLASIVEREAQVDAERPIIAGVFYNRLDQGMKLDADPTTQYALGHAGDWWPLLRLDPNTVDDPYNTYVHPGLPPGPISNPGLASIDAAIHPAHHDYLYFVACGNGKHAFATTLEEHERNRVRCGNR